jgi:hypothetical protein
LGGFRRGSEAADAAIAGIAGRAVDKGEAPPR